jgi:hypothetical protein
MRARHKRSTDSAERTTTRRKQPKNKSGLPKLSLGDCGVGAIWKDASR